MWNFSDGDSSTQAEVEKIFDFGSSFSATLTVQDSLSCTNSVTINGNADTFENYFDIYYPNVFTLMEMEKMISSLLKYQEEYMNVRNSSSITDGDKYNSYQQETTLDGMEEIV